MSWQATAYVAGIVEGISPAEKLLLMVLANRHNPDSGRCDPSLPRIAAEALTSERNCYRIIAKLQAKGLIGVVIGGGRRNTNQYSITGMTEKGDNLSGLNPARNPDRSNTETLTDSTETLTDQGLNPDTAMSPEPKNRKIEPKREPKAGHTLSLEADQLAALKARFPQSNIANELEEFNDYLLAKRPKYSDLLAAFRGSLRRHEANDRTTPPINHARRSPRTAGDTEAATAGWERFAAAEG